jgi:hypothetical protein
VAHVAQDDGTDRLLVEVQGQTERAPLELEQLVDRGVGQAGDAGDAVTRLDDRSDLLALQARLVALQVLAEDLGDVVGAEVEPGFVTGRGIGHVFSWSLRASAALRSSLI